MSTPKTPATPKEPPPVSVICERSIMFRSEAQMVDPNKPAAAAAKPYVQPGRSFIIPVSPKPFEIPGWVTELPEYQDAIDAGVLTEWQPAAKSKPAAGGQQAHPGGGGSTGPVKVPKSDEELEGMTKVELVDYGETIGLKLDARQSKDELIATISEAQEDMGKK
jgi:hypothetical protein